MDMRKLGYKLYSEEQPDKVILAEIVDENGLQSATGSLGPSGSSGIGFVPYWWRPAKTKDSGEGD
jgi:hypothetical protein